MKTLRYIGVRLVMLGPALLGISLSSSSPLLGDGLRDILDPRWRRRG